MATLLSIGTMRTLWWRNESSQLERFLREGLSPPRTMVGAILSVNFSKHHIQCSDDGDHICKHVSL